VQRDGLLLSQAKTLQYPLCKQTPSHPHQEHTAEQITGGGELSLLAVAMQAMLHSYF
jgi:hypothetical protein